MSNFETRIVTLEIWAGNLHDMRSRYICSRNLAICCNIFNRSALNQNGYQNIIFENRGVKCKQFQNFNGIVLLVNGKFACQEAEDFDLLHENEWIDTSCTMYSTKLFNQLKSIEDLHFLRDLNLIDNDKYIQVECDDKVVVVEKNSFQRYQNNLSDLLKTKYSRDAFKDGFINKLLKLGKK